MVMIVPGHDSNHTNHKNNNNNNINKGLMITTVNNNYNNSNNSKGHMTVKNVGKPISKSPEELTNAQMI